MGPLRRRLTALATFAATPAWAEVCDKQRPEWDGLPVTPMAEAIALFSTLPALILIVATMLTWRFRHVWGGLIVVLLWSTLLTALVSFDPTGLRTAARTEGCIGDPILFIGVVIAICMITLVLTAPRRAPTKNKES